MNFLLSDVQLLDNVEVTLRLDLSQVIEMTTTTTNHRNQATPAGVVLLVGAEVFSQGIDPAGQDSDLDFG